MAHVLTPTRNCLSGTRSGAWVRHSPGAGESHRLRTRAGVSREDGPCASLVDRGWPNRGSAAGAALSAEQTPAAPLISTHSGVASRPLVSGCGDGRQLPRTARHRTAAGDLASRKTNPNARKLLASYLLGEFGNCARSLYRFALNRLVLFNAQPPDWCARVAELPVLTRFRRLTPIR
jgi:hypothetical protein